MMDALRLAFGTLTAIPVPPPRRADRGVAGLAMLLAPLTQLPVAVALLGWGWLVRLLPMSPLVGAVVALAVIVLVARAMHLDGLADTADGLSASYERTRALEVMRRGNIGPSGVAAVVLVLIADLAALATLLQTWPGVVLACVCLLASRWTLAGACAAGVPAARTDGLGATVAGSVGHPAVTVSALALGSMAVGAAVAIGQPWWHGLAVVVVAAAAAAATIHRAVTRFGGITGDVLGAVVEISLAAALVTAAIVLGR